MNEPMTKAGGWLLDRTRWDDGMRGFFVRINATAGPDDMHRHVLAIEAEAAEMEHTRLSHLGAEKTTPQKQADALRRWNPEIVAVIEAAERARIAAEIRGLPVFAGTEHVDRAAVLAIVEGEV